MTNFSEMIRQNAREAGLAEGRAEGIEQEHTRMLNNIYRVKELYKEGTPLEIIVSETGLTQEEIDIIL